MGLILSTTYHCSSSHQATYYSCCGYSYLLLDERFNTPVIPPPLEIPFQDSHAFSFEHQLGFPASPYIQGFYPPCPLPLFLSDWSHIGIFIDTGVIPFWGAMESQASIIGFFIVP
jgi:hypothetical protein